RRLLELERNRLLMYTSCGWFFDEISAIEPVQILRYAAMALQYMNDLGGGRLEDEFVRWRAAAPSNVPEMRDGAEVYRRLIRPTAVNLSRVVTHYAITGLLDEYPADECSSSSSTTPGTRPSLPNPASRPPRPARRRRAPPARLRMCGSARRRRARRARR